MGVDKLQYRLMIHHLCDMNIARRRNNHSSTTMSMWHLPPVSLWKYCWYFIKEHHASDTFNFDGKVSAHFSFRVSTFFHAMVGGTVQ